MDDERTPLYNILGSTFETLGGLINQLIMVEDEAAY